MQEKPQFVHSNEDCFRNAPGLYFSKDINGVYTACNDTFARLVGMHLPEEVIGKNDYELSCREQANTLRENDQEIITSGHEKVFEEFVILANGERVTYLVTKRPVFDDTHTVVGLSGFCIDITRYKEEARNAQLNLEQVVACMPGSVYWKNREGVYLGCNDELADLFGLPRSEVPGKTDYDFAKKLGWSDEIVDAFVTKDREIIASGEARLGFEEPPFKFANGKVIHQLDNKMPLRDISGNVVGVVGIGIDITERKRAESEAALLKLEMERERQKNEMLQLEKKAQQFLAEQQAKFKEIVEKAVHDLNSPLQLISTGINSCNGVLPEEQLTQLQRSYGNVLSILKDLAKNYKIKTDSLFSKNESRQDLLIMDFLADVLDEKKLQYIKHPISFEFSTTEAAKAAHIDAQSGRLRRALSNLLNNAIDALPKNNGVIKVALDASEESVFITICDNGHGMTPETVQRILERVSFTENKTNGHGIGLQQVWEALEYNRGTMKIESTIGKGTSFILAFPRFQPTNWIAQEIVLYRDTILLILEDEKSFHVSWDIYLSSKIGRSRATQVKYFCEGAEAFNFVSGLAEEERKRVLLLADYELANQTLTGLDVIISCNMTNAILITGHANDAEIRHAALRQGITLLPKQLISDTPIRLVKHPLQVA